MRAESHWNSNAPVANGSLMDPAFLRQVVDDSNPAFRGVEQKHSATHLWQACLAGAHALRVWATGGAAKH